MKKFKIVALVLLVLMVVVITSLGLFYNIKMKGVSDDTTPKIVVIEEGTVRDIANTLKDNNLIKDVKIFMLYIKITGKSNLKASTYKLSENMGVKKIVDILEKGNSYNPDEITITFKEGINMRDVANLISSNTNNSEESVYELLNDTTYLDELINKYWFLTNDIKNSYIYYSLEGYLFPDTYSFLNKDVTVKDIFKSLLDETEKKISAYKEDILKLDLSVHEYFTLASIVELEGANSDDRKAVAGVFYNRLNDNWTLGSDVTTYYASKIDDFKYSLTYKELNDCSNYYNTRCNSYIGLPVGPIANPGLDSLEATLYPTEHNYYYFVADCSGKTYLNTNSYGHSQTIKKLQNENNWCA